MEEDEELLLLRIKALKSSSRVNIQVDIHPDSDNEQVKSKQSSVSAGINILNHEITRENQNKTVVIDASNTEKIIHVSEATTDELALRQMALNSLQPKKPSCARKSIDTVDTSLPDNTMLEEAPEHPPSESRTNESSSTPSTVKKFTADGKNVEELCLREKALKTLLQKRVAMTEELIKHAVQHEGVSSTVNGKENNEKELPVTTSSQLLDQTIKENLVPNGDMSVKPVKLNRKKIIRMSSSLPTVVLRNFLPPQTSIDKNIDKNADKNDSDSPNLSIQLERLSSVQIGSDDELSLCASDREEVELDENAFVENTNTEHETGDAATNTAATQNDNSIILSDIQCNVITSCFRKDTNAEPLRVLIASVESQKETHSSANSNDKDNEKTDIEMGKDIADEKSIKGEIESKTSKKQHNVQATIHNIIDDNCEAGPSGYQKTMLVSDNDSDASSIMEIDAPMKRKPRVVSLVSDSDSENESSTGKQKAKKKKRKKTVKECLMKQEGIHDNRDDLTDLNCSVCLGPFDNRSFLKECFHSFCHLCIIQWSELSRLCPLCKKHYNALIHSVTRDLDYEEFVFPVEETEVTPKPRQGRVGNWEFSETMDDGRRFRYQSTITNHETWAVRKEDRERSQQQHVQNRNQRMMSRRLKWSATKDRRKAVYRTNMFVKQVKQRGKPLYRDISPKFFTENPAVKHRLVPWLLRDLNVLLGENDENIRFVMSLILNLISQVSIDGNEFKKQLKSFLFEKTEHFIAELISFSSSPYDIRGYDDNVVYDVQPEVISIDTEKDPFEARLLHEVFLGNNEIENSIHIIDDTNKTNNLQKEESSNEDTDFFVSPPQENNIIEINNEENITQNKTEHSHVNKTTKNENEEIEPLNNTEIEEANAGSFDDNRVEDETDREKRDKKKKKKKKKRKKKLKRIQRKIKRKRDSSDEDVGTDNEEDERRNRRTSSDGNRNRQSNISEEQQQPLISNNEQVEERKRKYNLNTEDEEESKKETVKSPSEAEVKDNLSADDGEEYKVDKKVRKHKKKHHKKHKKNKYKKMKHNTTNSHVTDFNVVTENICTTSAPITDKCLKIDKNSKLEKHTDCIDDQGKENTSEETDCINDKGIENTGKETDKGKENISPEALLTETVESIKIDNPAVEENTKYNTRNDDDEESTFEGRRTLRSMIQIPMPNNNATERLSFNVEGNTRKRERSYSSEIEKHKHKRKKHKHKDHKHKDHKKKHKKRKHSDENYVTHRLHKLLGSKDANKESNDNVTQLNVKFKKYVQQVGDKRDKKLIEDRGALKTQAEIIAELLEVEKAILRRSKKKELIALQKKGDKLEEIRTRRKVSGKETYREFDNELHDLGIKIHQCKKSLEKLNSNS